VLGDRTEVEQRPIYITATIRLFPRLGAVVSVGLFIAGQMLASLALDALGLLGVPLRPIGLGDAAGLLAVNEGAALIVRAQGGAQASQARSARRVGWILLADSPYARRRELRRMAAATAFMHDYTVLADELRSASLLPALVLRSCEGRWEACRRWMLALLES